MKEDQELRLRVPALLAEHSTQKRSYRFDPEHVCLFAGVLMGDVFRTSGELVDVMRCIRIVAEVFEILEKARDREPGSGMAVPR